MSVWDWITDYELDARVKGDPQRLRLCELYREAERHWTDPDRALDFYEQGRRLAQSLDEPWWVLFFDHWKLQVLLHDKGDYRQVHALAVQATLEARKPIYAELPQRICLHEDLIWSYVDTDPGGHAELIEDALAYMEKEITDDLECRYCLQNCRAEFSLACGQPAEALSASRRALAMAQEEGWTANHYAMSAHSKLCALAYLRGDWEELRESAREGEALAVSRDRPVSLATFLLWQAVLARHEGDDRAAKRLLRRGQRTAAGTREQRGQRYYDALVAFHELGGDLEAALATREEELAEISDKDALYREARTQVERCKLLARLGRLSEGLAAARTAARRLRRPGPWLAELDRLGGVSPRTESEGPL